MTIPEAHRVRTAERRRRGSDGKCDMTGLIVVQRALQGGASGASSMLSTVGLIGGRRQDREHIDDGWSRL